MTSTHKARLTRRFSNTSKWQSRQRIGSLLNQIREAAGEADLCLDEKKWSQATNAISELLKLDFALATEIQ